MLDRFAEVGGNFIDTAHIYGAWCPNGVNGGYGNSETVIGRWMKDRDCREQMIVSTKGGHPWFENGKSSMNRETVLQQLQESLDRLQTNYVDIYWMHRDDRSVPVDEIFSWLQEPLDQGIIRSIGLSHWKIDRMEQAGDRFIASQVSWSLATLVEPIDDLFGEQLSMTDELLKYHQQRNLPSVTFNAQAGGFFAPKYDDMDFFRASPLAQRFDSERNLKNRATACELAKEKGCSANQIALAWLLHQPLSVFALAGPNNLDQLNDSLGAMDIELSPEELGRFV
jgi:aryl-alcohol dehydrogenase-like predicted oxidoreductase